MSRKTLGRQKIEMVKMTKESNLQVTFSKRRTGLFKKASELSTLCGAEIAIVVFSPGKKVFSYGNPSVDTIIDRFLTQNNTHPTPNSAQQLIEAHRSAMVHDLNIQLTQVLSELDIEKRRGKELTEMRKARKPECWWEDPIQELNLVQLEQLKASLEEVKVNVAREAQRHFMLQLSNPHMQHLSSGSASGCVPATFYSVNVSPSYTNVNEGFNPNMMCPGRGFH